MKYVIGRSYLTGIIVPVVFAENGIHKLFANALKKSGDRLEISSAGFVYKVGSNWEVSTDESDSLGIGPKPEDQVILTLFLDSGLTGLDLQNTLAFLAMQNK